jgi:hypothetical protein
VHSWTQASSRRTTSAGTFARSKSRSRTRSRPSRRARSPPDRAAPSRLVMGRVF